MYCMPFSGFILREEFFANIADMLQILFMNTVSPMRYKNAISEVRYCQQFSKNLTREIRYLVSHKLNGNLKFAVCQFRK